MPDATPKKPAPLEVTICERLVKFDAPDEGQLAVMMRGVAAWQRGGPLVLKGVTMILDVLDALIVSPDDVAFLEAEMTAGRAGLKHMQAMLDEIGVEMAQDAEPAKPTPAARRGRR